MREIIDRLDEFSSRYQRALSVVGAGWAILTWATYAQFISLPDFIRLDETIVMVLGVLYNVIWWGFLYPRVEHHRKNRDGANVGGKA